MDDRSDLLRRQLRRIRRRYALARTRERLLRRGAPSLDNDALRVALEWGPAARISEEWRLQQRQPKVPAQGITSALEHAHRVCHEAYTLTAGAWPPDRREIGAEVDRHARQALQALKARYPGLEPDLLLRAVSHANYTHAK